MAQHKRTKWRAVLHDRLHKKTYHLDWSATVSRVSLKTIFPNTLVARLSIKKDGDERIVFDPESPKIFPSPKLLAQLALLLPERESKTFREVG